MVGATGATLVLTNFTSAAVGTYSVVVANSAGRVTSPGAVIAVGRTTVSTPPQISSQPASTTVNAGSTVALNVGATGTAPLTYQWRKDGSVLSGATNASLVLTNVQPTGAGAYLVSGRKQAFF